MSQLGNRENGRTSWSSLNIASSTLLFGATCICLMWAERRNGISLAAITVGLALGPAVVTLFWARLRRAALARGILLAAGCVAAAVGVALASRAGVSLLWIGVLASGSLVVAADTARYEHATRRRTILHALVLGGAWLLVVCVVGARDLAEAGTDRPASGDIAGWLAVVACGLAGTVMVGCAGSEVLYGSEPPRRLGSRAPVEPTMWSRLWRGLLAMLLAMVANVGWFLFVWPAFFMPPLFLVVLLPFIFLFARACDLHEPRNPSNALTT